MFFHQLLDPDLGCASYVLGCHGRAVVVDPGIDTDRYLKCLQQVGATLDTIVETHTHADHVSGRGELAAATGARVRLPWVNGPEGLAAGDTISVGQVRIEVIAAPGHRPEHIALGVIDTDRSEDPWLILSGDSLLVGDLARPDLAVDPQDGAKALRETISRLCELGDCVELWPGHVGGSLCGGAGLSPKTSSTIGYERSANPLTRSRDGEEFARLLLDGLPPRPPTVERVVARNAATSAPAAVARVLGIEDLQAALESPETVFLDGRPADRFEAAHLIGSVNLPLSGTGLGTRVAWLLDPETPIVVCADREEECAELARRLRAVAIDGVLGIAPGGVARLRECGGEIGSEAGIAVADLARRLTDFTVVDVRGQREWDAGHLVGSVHLPPERLREGADLLPGTPLAVACATGNRAAFAASWLRRQGHSAVRLTGGGISDLAAHEIDPIGR
ncbi:MAG: MBL fold metallo-hydrolase [Solirubrobacterales bacterium]